MITSTLYDSHKRPLRLRAEIGRGGEGAVFDLEYENLDAVAKIYHQPLPVAKQAKLLGMVRSYTPDLGLVTAWPTDLVYRQPGGPPIGFIMPETRGYEPIHKLYSPIDRKKYFGAVDWQFLIVAARNAAASVATVHAAGAVIGDINFNSFMVAQDATVKLIDCDSFQIQIDEQTHLCLVGTDEFTPPELQGKSFATTLRTPNHDAFGLAVMLFRLLFMGRHPYAGVYRGPGDMPLARAIQEGCYAYGVRASSMQTAPPPQSLPVAAAGEQMVQLFERSFALETGIAGRPTAVQWMQALAELSQNLTICPEQPAHKYLRTLSTCPWCVLENQSHAYFFIAYTPVAVIDVGLVWRQISTIKPPPSVGAPSLAATMTPTPLTGANVGDTGRITRNEFQSIMIEQQERLIRRDKARAAWDAFLGRWSQYAADRSFDNAMQAALTLRRQYEELAEQRTSAHQQLEVTAANTQSTVTAAQRAAIDAQYQRPLAAVAGDLAAMPSTLNRIRQDLLNQRTALTQEGAVLAGELAQVEADLTLANQAVRLATARRAPWERWWSNSTQRVAHWRNNLPRTSDLAPSVDDLKAAAAWLRGNPRVIAICLVWALIFLSNYAGAIVRTANNAMTFLTSMAQSTPDNSRTLTLPPLTPDYTGSQPKEPMSNQIANLRLGPGIDFEVIDLVTEGQPMTVSGRSADGKWLQVDGYKWIPAQAVDNAPTEIPVVEAPTPFITPGPSSRDAGVKH